MKVVVDLDPRTVWRLDTIAEEQGTDLSTVVRAQLAAQIEHLPVVRRIRARVLAGMCDADIAAELNMTNNRIAAIRRGEGLPANRRNGRKTA